MPFGIGIGLGLKLLGVAGKIKRGIAWCFGTPTRILFTVLLITMAFLLFRLWRVDAERDDWRDASNSWQDAALSWESALNKFVVDVQLGREAAAKLDAANAARVASEMARIKKDSSDDLEKLRTDTRAAARQLRDKLLAATANGSESGSGEAAMSGDLAARCRAFGYPDCDALLTALPRLLEAAEDNTNKLIALQAWVNALLKIDMNGEDTDENAG